MAAVTATGSVPRLQVGSVDLRSHGRTAVIADFRRYRGRKGVNLPPFFSEGCGRRRAFIAALGGAAAWPLVATKQIEAQERTKIPRVGVLTPAESDTTPGFDAFRKGLRDLGYVEGKSIVLDFRFAKGHTDALPRLAAELVQIPVDVIVASGTTAARAAAGITHEIPIVQPAGGDLVTAGLAASLARPGGNVTGLTIRTDEPSGKRLELLRDAFPGIKRVTVMLDPTSVVTPPQLRSTEGAAAHLHIQLAKLPVSTPEELGALGPTALAGSDGLVVLPASCSITIAQPSLRSRRPRAYRRSTRRASSRTTAASWLMVPTFRMPTAVLPATLIAFCAALSRAISRSSSRRRSTSSSIFARRENSGSLRPPVFSSESAR